MKNAIGAGDSLNHLKEMSSHSETSLKVTYEDRQERFSFKGERPRDRSLSS